MKIKFKDFAEFYAHLCDVIERDYLDIPDDDPFMHTSDYARALSRRITDRLINEGFIKESECQS